MEKADSFLMAAVFGGNDIEAELDRSNPNLDVLPPQNPIEKFVADRAFELELEKSGGRIFDSSWNEPIGVEKREGSKPLGKCVHTEIKIDEDGLRSAYFYDASGSLLDMRTLLSEIEVE